MSTKVSLLQKHSYSWWCKASNIYFNGYNYYTTVNINGDLCFNRYKEGETPVVSVIKNLDVDEHNRPSFIKRDNDFLVFCHPRNDRRFEVRSYDFDLNPTSELYHIGTTSNANFQGANYSQPYLINDRIFLFCRETSTNWALTWTDSDGFGDWTTRLNIFTNSNLGLDKLYMLTEQKGDDIYMCITSHPTTNSSNYLALAKLNTVSGDITQNGTLLGNVYDSQFATISIDTLTRAFSPDSGKGVRLLDLSFIGDRINVLFCHFDNDYEDGNYVLGQYDIDTFQEIQQLVITSHGRDVYTTYFGGANMSKSMDGNWVNNEIYLAKEDSGTWYVELWELSGSSFLKVSEIDSRATTAEGLSFSRPEVPLNSNLGGLSVIYQKNDYVPNNDDVGSFEDWEGEIIGLLPGGGNPDPDPDPDTNPEENYLFNRYNSVPSTLKNKTFGLVKTASGFKMYVGDSNNNPVPLDTGASFTNIDKDEYGNHPAFSNQHDLNVFLLSTKDQPYVDVFPDTGRLFRYNFSQETAQLSDLDGNFPGILNVQGSKTVQDSLIGKSWKTNSNSSVYIGNPFENQTVPLSVIFLFKKIGASDNVFLIGSNASDYAGFNLDINASGLRFRSGNGEGIASLNRRSYEAISFPQDTNWHLVALNIIDVTNASISIDGGDFQALTYTDGDAEDIDLTEPFNLGKSTWGAEDDSYFTPAEFDEAAGYSRLLTNQEVSDIWTAINNQ